MNSLLLTILLFSSGQARPVLPVPASIRAAAQGTADTTQTPLKMPTDTGRMIWGREDFSRYDAQACDRAFMSELWTLGRTRAQDTIFRRVGDDTLPQQVKAITRACGHGFTAENTPEVHLWSNLRIALAAERDNEIPSIVARKVALAQTLPEKASALLVAIETVLGARPARLAIAQQFMTQLDSLGPEAKRYQYRAYTLLLGYWDLRLQRDSIIRYAEDLIARYHAMEPNEKDEVNVMVPYAVLLRLADLEGDTTKQESVIQLVSRNLESWRLGSGKPMIQALSSMLTIRKQLYNKPMRQLDGAFWFNKEEAQLPVPGKMSLFVHIDHRLGAQNTRLFTLIRQLHRQYGDALVITLITETRGYTVGSGPLEPADEAKQVASYFLDFLKLPVIVLVDQAPYETLPDGRRMYSTAPVGETFWGWRLFGSVLTDKTGKIRWFGNMGSEGDEARMVALMERLDK